MLTFKRNTRLMLTLGALSMVAALAACGGSDDPVTEPVVAAPAVAEVKLPEGSTSTGLTVTGILKYGVFSPGASIPREESADVANDGLDGTLTLKASVVAAASDRAAPAAVANDSFVVATANGWSIAQWPEGSDGVLALDGNAAMFCNTSVNSGQIGISGNLTQVVNLADLRGKTFQYKTCANGAVENDGGITFNPDGSAVFEGDGESDLFSARGVAAYFSEEGWSFEEGNFNAPSEEDEFKARALAFYREVSGTREYVIVDISDDRLNLPLIKTVALMVEVAPK